MTTERIATPWESPGFLLWHATLRWQRATTAALRPFGITHVQFVLLASIWWLGESGDAPSQHQLAEHCGTDPMMTSQVARTLEAKGLLTRASDPADGRVRRMSVTPAGRAMALRAIVVVEAADRAYFAPVANQPALRQLLNTLAVPSASSRSPRAHGRVTPTKYWLGVVSREHVKRGLDLGIAQIGHGKRAGLSRMRTGDWLIYYSPTVSLGRREPLQAFTAIGQIADDLVWQADVGDFKPWRRRVNYCSGAADTPLRSLAATLDLTSTPNWGYQLRRGLIELSEHDFHAIRTAMRATLPAGTGNGTPR